MRSRALAAFAALVGSVAFSPVAGAAGPPPGGVPGVQVPGLSWAPCTATGQQGFLCATASVPRDYAVPGGAKIDLALIKLPAQDPAHRIGTLFTNPGGPGGSGVDLVANAGKADFAPLNQRFDLVGWDPRGVARSSGVRCLDDAAEDARQLQPPTTPQNLDPRAWLDDAVGYGSKCASRNKSIAPYISTLNTVRDLDVLRAAVGDDKLTYLGFSYGTAIGAMYDTLFGARARALVLDGTVDQGYFTDPVQGSYSQTAAFEHALGRFFDRCAAEQPGCGFGGSDPHAAFEGLIAQLDAHPITGSTRTLNGHDVRLAALISMYNIHFWPLLSTALAGAAKGDGRLLQLLSDTALGRTPDGHYDGANDQFFAVYGVDGAWPRNPFLYAREGYRSFSDFPHFWFNHGYSELPWGLYPVRARGVYRGPLFAQPGAPTALLIGTTNDPATPYPDTASLARELGNATEMTMEGDGHTASFGNNTRCVDDRVLAYLEDGALPAEGTVCQQQADPFAAAPAAAASASTGAGTAALRAGRRALKRFAERATPAMAVALGG